MNEVVLALEGSVAPMNCFVEEDGDGRVLCSHHDDSGRGCATKLLWTRVQANVLKTLADTTLAELVEFHNRQFSPTARAGDDPRLRPKETMPELEIRNLHVQAEDKQILKGVDLTVRPGEIHALMGPNGSGKSTLANAIMGHPNLEVTEGQILFDGVDITEADTDERARMGLFMAFQYPVAIPGVTVTKYLRMVMNAHREARGEPDVSLKEFRKTVEAAMELVKVPREFSSRYLNEGFSGGEKKRMEILQLALQKPGLAILDETDSGLDIDALNVVAHGVNTVADGQMGVLIITHYQRILHMVTPTRVSIMFDGRIATEGGPELVDAPRGRGLRADPRRVRHVGVSTLADTPLATGFPSLEREGVVYLDTAATSQTPQPVLDAMNDYYEHHRGTVHRSVYPLAAEATELFEGARDRIAAWLNWPARATIFTKNATEAVNLVAYSWGRANVGPGDTVVVTRDGAPLELRAVAHALPGGRRGVRGRRRRRRVAC